ncbi:MAG TPA: UPF0149 family protein [Candidatus Angelobacter sp.]|nr:UPF0149 family protein [Candidatus Angelobacter sp.]
MALEAWLTFLSSPAAPKAAMSPLELDGYLTGIIVSPQSDPIMPSKWLAGLWGDEEPVFDGDEQIKAVLGAVMEHYNALIANIDRSLKRLEADGISDYRPMFLSGDGKPPHDVVRSWVRGFWKAMALTPVAWRALAEDERTQVLIEPFIGFFEVDDGEPLEVPDDVDAIVDEGAAAIPRAITVLHKLAQIRHSRPAAPARRSKVGRNDLCPCGSGKKYKRCCGAD